MKRTQVAILSAIGLSVFATIVVSMRAPLSGDSAPEVSKRDSGVSASGAPNRADVSRDVRGAPGSRVPSSIPQQSGASAPSAVSEFRFSTELTQFAKLKDKVFLSEQDKAERAKLLGDKELLRALEEVLKKPTALNSREQDLQNDAIDLLLEALATPSSAIASEVLKAVVTDRQLENEQLDMASREALAGVKAEVMYQWSAIDPERANQIPTWLPGPVSERIWKNVLNAQEQNLRESAQETGKLAD